MFQSSKAIGACHAMERGILAYNTARIEGPWQGGIVSIAPWMLSIVASSTDCRIVDKVVLGNGTTLKVCVINSPSFEYLV